MELLLDHEKRDGVVQAFQGAIFLFDAASQLIEADDAGKFLLAIRHRHVLMAQVGHDIERILDRIVNDITNKYESEVPGTAIGERVMAELRELDEVAYVRFASVYRRFQEATDFVHEIKKMEADK